MPECPPRLRDRVRGLEHGHVRREQFDDPAVLRAARRILREALEIHLGGRPMRVRAVALAMHRELARDRLGGGGR